MTRRSRFRPLLVLTFLFASAGGAYAQGCARDFVDLRDSGSTFRFAVELAETPEMRARGLMFRDSMPRFSAMLFVYEFPQPVAFWMENTFIPLDMLFFDQAGRLVKVHHEAQPLDRTVVPGGDNIRYVLEINAGLAQELGIEEGAELRHPVIEAEVAAWPCAAE